jgi:carboxyl-terminal processing protease
MESDKKPDAHPAVKEESKDSLSLEQELQQDYQLLRALDLLKGWELLKGLKKAAA